MVGRGKEQPPATLADRAGMALGSAALAFPFAAFLWFALQQFLATESDASLLPFRVVWYFTGLIAVLGFLLAENVLIAIFTALMELAFGEKSKTP